MIKLKNITKFYDNKAIISNLSLDFHKGKITSMNRSQWRWKIHSFSSSESFDKT